jgi:hypothetical protein
MSLKPPAVSPMVPVRIPGHWDLPFENHSVPHNFQELPQSMLLTECLEPVLRVSHPDGQYCIGQDCGIYWRPGEVTLERGAVSPDWYYVPNVPPLLNGQMRRSYVMWEEWVPPLIILEYASGDGSEERDSTPRSGKFWVYERVIRPAYYGISIIDTDHLEVYRLVDNEFERLPPNERGHYPIARLGVELGIWRGRYLDINYPWMRWWDSQGNLLPTGDERAAAERLRVEQERRRAEEERQRAEAEAQRADQERQAKETALSENERLRERLRALGIDPDALPG